MQKKELICKIRKKLEEYPRTESKIKKETGSVDDECETKNESKSPVKSGGGEALKKKEETLKCLWDTKLYQLDILSTVTDPELKKFRINKLEKLEKDLNTLPSLWEIKEPNN